MTTQDQARALMTRHSHLIRNRQQCMLHRAAAEVGMPTEQVHYEGKIQGKIQPTFRIDYDPSHAALS
jgi:hypothetical protein